MYPFCDLLQGRPIQPSLACCCHSTIIIILLFFPLFPSSTLSAASENSSTDNTSYWILIGICIAAFALLLLLAFFRCFRIKIREEEAADEEAAGGCETAKSPAPDEGSAPSSDGSKSSVRRFAWEEMARLTSNFSSVIGHGGFSTVYLAQFSDSSLGALKIHSSSERLNRVFKQELEILMQVRHESIVKLIGYCDEREEGALVFEYVPSGSLHEKLHGHRRSGEAGGGHGRGRPLAWEQRTSIAFQLAKALEYLHDGCPLPVIHGDVKASNVLLDERLRCKLCDFGSSKMGFSSTVRPSAPMVGSAGYADPHYLRTGIISKKNDVYSYGVLLLELLTGIEAFCEERQQLLTSIAGPILADAAPATTMVDPRLDGEFDAEEAAAMASIARQCVLDQPAMRPAMSEIVTIIGDRIPSCQPQMSESPLTGAEL